MFFNRAMKVAAVLFGTVAVVVCQTQAIPKNRETPSRYSSVEFSLSQAKLPPNYHGHDFRRIYTVLHKRTSLLQGEFESRADYDKRTAAQLTQPLVGKMTTGSLYAFQVPTDSTYYNADKEILETRVSSKVDFCIGSCKKPFPQRIALASRVVYAHREPMTNAYGAIVDVTVQKQEIYELHLETYPEQFDAQVNLAVPRAQAPAVKNQLRAIAVCRFQSPWTWSSHDYSSPPTFDSPYLDAIDRNSLVVDLVDIWFYDLATGEVFAKVSGAPVSLGSAVMAKVAMHHHSSPGPVQIIVDGKPFLEARFGISETLVVARKEVVVKVDDGKTVELFCGGEHLTALTDVHNEATATCTAAGVHVEVGQPTTGRRFTLLVKPEGFAVFDITVDGKLFPEGSLSWNRSQSVSTISAEKEVVITGWGAEVSFEGHDGPHHLHLPKSGDKGMVTVTAAEVDY